LEQKVQTLYFCSIKVFKRHHANSAFLKVMYNVVHTVG